MHIFSWLTRILNNRTDLSMFDLHSQTVKDLGEECRRFMQKGSFVELKLGGAQGAVRGHEARTGSYKGGAQVSAR